VLPYLAPVLIVGLLWLLDARTLAVVVLIVAAVVTTATSLSPRARGLFDRAAGWIAHHVGNILTVALLGLVQLVIFAPIAAIAKLTRTDPMDPLGGRATESRWLARSPTDRTLERRQYADEAYRRRVAGGQTPVGSPRWIRGAVGGVALLLLADVALGSLFVRLDREEAVPLDGPVFGFDPIAQEALSTQPRSRELMSDITQAGIGDPDAFIGWRFGPGVTYASELVNIVDGRRSTLESTVDGDAVDVWLFGGSTLYGSGQSDAATIPSVLVRLAATDGVRIDATNYGHPAYAQWQQVQLLEAELTAGNAVPDVVVFYDGFNDLTLQTYYGVHEEPTHLFFGTPAAAAEPTASVASTVRTWWADHSATALAVGRVRDVFEDEPTIQVADVNAAPIDSIDPVAAGDAAAAIHRRGVDHVVALGEAYGFEPVFFWQPYLYTKDPLTPAESDLVGLPGYDTDVWIPMTERIRSNLREPVVDLSDALDGVDSSLFWDFVHTNETGARLITEAIYSHLAVVLAR
jgi:hypothetical protein